MNKTCYLVTMLIIALFIIALIVTVVVLGHGKFKMLFKSKKNDALFVETEHQKDTLDK